MAAEPITIGYVGSKTVTLAIRRDSDLAWFDFNDTTFKTVGWTTPEQTMTEQTGAGLPTGLVGAYRVTVDPGAWTDGSYAAYVQDSLVTTKPVGYSQFLVKNGTIVADILLDAAITSRLAPTVAARTLDVSAGGEAGIDWANVGSPTTAVNLSATNIDVDQIVASVSGAVGSVTAGVTLAASAVQAIWDALTSALVAVGSIGKLLVDNINATISSRASQTSVDTVDDLLDTEILAIIADTEDIQARLPAALVTGRIDASIGAMAANVMTAAAAAADLTTELQAGLATAAALTTAQTDITAIKAKTDNLPSGVKKNTALANFTFAMFGSADGRTPKTGLTVTAQRSLDGAALAVCANAVTELSNGLYTIDLAAADLNGDIVVLRFTATGADPTLLTIVTEP